MPGVVVEHVGLDASRGDGVDGDALRARVGREGAGEALDGGFGTSVESVVLDAGHVGRDGGHEDNAAALWREEGSVWKGKEGDGDLKWNEMGMESSLIRVTLAKILIDLPCKCFSACCATKNCPLVFKLNT